MIISDLERLVDGITREKNIPRDVVIEILESAMVAAARKRYGMVRDIEAQYNEELGEVELFEFHTVVEEIEDEDIDEIEIEFITFDVLIEKFEIESIDKLQIDVEGAEYEILKSINYKKTNINSIQFESKHFDGTFKEGPKLKEIENKLIFEGYDLKKIDNENVLAVKKN